MQSKCILNAVKIQSKCSQIEVLIDWKVFSLVCISGEKFRRQKHKSQPNSRQSPRRFWSKSNRDDESMEIHFALQWSSESSRCLRWRTATLEIQRSWERNRSARLQLYPRSSRFWSIKVTKLFFSISNFAMWRQTLEIELLVYITLRNLLKLSHATYYIFSRVLNKKRAHFLSFHKSLKKK